MRNSTRALIGASALGVAVLLLHSFYYHEQYPAWTSLLPQPATPTGRFDDKQHDPYAALRNFRANVPAVRDPEDLGFPEGYIAPSEGAGERPLFNWVKSTQFVAFGDSFTTNFWKIREKGPNNGYQGYYTHLEHSLRGRTWADWLWAQFGYVFQTKYYNLARRGASICWDILPPSQKPWGTYEDQIIDFIDFFVEDKLGKPVEWDPATSSFIVMFGINDVSHLVRGDGGFDGSKLPVKETCQALVERLFEYTMRLHAVGARNFIFMNLPPFHRVPKYLAPSQPGYDVAERAIEAVKWFNHFYDIEFEKFKANRTDSNAFLFDLGNFMTAVLDWPELFGITETMRFRVETEGDEHQVERGKLGLMWEDFQHPSWTVHNLIARALHGFLLRQSPVFQASNTTDVGIYVAQDPIWPPV